MKFRRRALVLTTVLVVVAVTGSAAAAADDSGAELAAASASSEYCADMADAVGLYVGNPVTQMGFRIGTVRAISPMGTFARVEFDVENGRAIPATVNAVTRSKSLLADRSLELVGNYVDGPTLEPGACVDTTKTFTPKTISEIAGSSADFLESLTSSGGTSVEDSIAGLDRAMAGTQEAANSMMTQAAAAAASPEQVTADIGSSIMNMAPLTDEALKNWGTIRSILDQMPQISVKATDLFAQVAKFDRGVGWLVATIYDIQRNYGTEIWPVVHGPVTDLVKAAAARTPDIRSLYETVPAVSNALDRQVQVAGGLAAPAVSPKLVIDPQTCATIGTVCEDGTVDVLGLILGVSAHG